MVVHRIRPWILRRSPTTRAIAARMRFAPQLKLVRQEGVIQRTADLSVWGLPARHRLISRPVRTDANPPTAPATRDTRTFARRRGSPHAAPLSVRCGAGRPATQFASHLRTRAVRFRANVPRCLSVSRSRVHATASLSWGRRSPGGLRYSRHSRLKSMSSLTDQHSECVRGRDTVVRTQASASRPSERPHADKTFHTDNATAHASA
jgi:hypothetical protein